MRAKSAIESKVKRLLPMLPLLLIFSLTASFALFASSESVAMAESTKAPKAPKAPAKTAKRKGAPTSMSFLTKSEEQDYIRNKSMGEQAKAAYARAKASADASRPFMEAEQARFAGIIKAQSDAATLQEAQESQRMQAQAAAKAQADYQAAQAHKSDIKKVAASAEKEKQKDSFVLIARLSCEKRLKPGGECHLTVTTRPEAECHTVISWGAGPSLQKVLPDLTADESGTAEFRFAVPADCKRSYLIINTECSLGNAHIMELKKVDVEH